MSRSKSPCFQSLPAPTREEILCLMDELGLVPSVVLTPSLVNMIQDEFRKEISRVNSLKEDLEDRRYFLQYFKNRSRKRVSTLLKEDDLFISPELELFPSEYK